MDDYLLRYQVGITLIGCSARLLATGIRDSERGEWLREGRAFLSWLINRQVVVARLSHMAIGSEHIYTGLYKVCTLLGTIQVGCWPVLFKLRF